MLVASALRVVVLPSLARAQEAGGSFGSVVARADSRSRSVRARVVVSVPGDRLDARDVLAGGLPPAQDAAAELLPWLVPAAVAQLYAGSPRVGSPRYDGYGTAAARLSGSGASSAWR